MKSEVKIEIENTKLLENLFKDSYENGTILDNTKSIVLDKSDDLYKFFEESHNIIIRVTNKDLIDGFCRFILDLRDDRLVMRPVSINYIEEGEKWIFF
jgi:hypothetical protein